MSTLSGVPVPTLRVWESRYGAFQPTKTGGSHRLYNDEDVLRASLMRQLTHSGHAISTLARLNAAELSGLLHRQRQSQGLRDGPAAAMRTVTVTVVDLALATRLQSDRFLGGLPGVSLRVADAFADLQACATQAWRGRPDILLLRVNSLHLAAHDALRRLLQQHPVGQVIVLYGFGQERVSEAMKASGIIVRREPVSDLELADLIGAMLLIDPGQRPGQAQPGVLIPPRKYSDQTLMQVANARAHVLCECPRHVAELVAQLASFEQYSQECLNNTPRDAHVHAQLSAISGSARVMFERALELVAHHEGLDLQPDDTLAPPSAPA